jgi:hypothetical protein
VQQQFDRPPSATAGERGIALILVLWLLALLAILVPSPHDTAKPQHAASRVSLTNGRKTGLAAREDSIMPANLRLVSLVVAAAAVAVPARQHCGFGCATPETRR